MKIVCVCLVAALLSAPALFISACEEETGNASTGAPPPPDAQFLDEDATPEAVMLSVIRASKTPAGLAQAVGAVKGLWIPQPGWWGTVETVNDQQGGTTVGCKHYVSGMIGGEFWVLYLVPAGLDIRPGEQIAFQGKIRDVESKMAVTPVYRVIVEQCRILDRPNKK